MDEKLLKSVNRKLKMVNVWLSLYTGVTIFAVAFMGFMAFKIIGYINNLNNKIDSFNPKQSICQQNPDGLLKNRFCE